MDKFSELKAAAMAATPGPWFVHEKHCEDGSYGIDTSDNEWTAEAVVWWGFARESIWREEDARFIAAANPAVVLALLAELEASKKSNAFLKEQLAKLANFNPDWDMLEACRESWREVAAALKEAEAKLEAKDKCITELEAKMATPVRLPNKNDDEFWFDGVFQVAKFDRAVERAISAAGFKFAGDEQ